MSSKEVRQRAPPPIHSEWHHHHPRHSHSQQQQLTHTDTRNSRRKITAPGKHSDSHHQQEPRRALRPRISTHQATPTHKITNGWQKTTAALRSTHALPPIVPLLSLQRKAPAPPPAHITSHSRGIPRHQKHNKKDASAPVAAGRSVSAPTSGILNNAQQRQALQAPFNPISRPQQPESCACVRPQR
ncbi:exo-alpha-sialidase [Trypanosoma cruzi]|nr:exo-alpha-sialidase [Trypanosoma cruzi]